MEEPIGKLPNPAEDSEKILDKLALVSRKRKNEENIPENGQERERKKLKWETLRNKGCEMTIEYASYYSKPESQEIFEKLEKQIDYLRFVHNVTFNWIKVIFSTLLFRIQGSNWYIYLAPSIRFLVRGRRRNANLYARGRRRA